MKNYFIHIPKTGGLSIIHAFRDQEIIIIGHNLRDPKYILPRQIVQGNDYVFTFTRNPVDRLISAYYFLKNGGLSSEDANDAYLLDINRLNINQFIYKRLLWATKWQIHFIPIVYFLSGIKNVHIFKYENLSTDFYFLCSKFNLVTELPQINMNKFKPNIRLSSYEVDYIKKVYYRDFDAYYPINN